MEPFIGWENDRVREIFYISEVKARAKAMRTMSDATFIPQTLVYIVHTS